MNKEYTFMIFIIVYLDYFSLYERSQYVLSVLLCSLAQSSHQNTEINEVSTCPVMCG